MRGHPILECRGVTKFFGEACAVRDVSLTLEPGEILVLVGPSGSGKTTLLRLLAGFETLDNGTVSLEGRLVAGPEAWAPPEARRLGIVFQDYALFPHMTVLQNVLFGLNGWPRSERATRARQMLETVRMDHLAERYPYQLSGGEQQRVALARSLAPRPLALLLDEPFSNLDPQLRREMRTEVKDILRSSEVTAMHITHNQQEALLMGERVAVMNAGRVEQVGTPEEIYLRPRTRFVAQFLGAQDFIPARATEDGLVTEIGVLHPETPLPLGTEVEVIAHPNDIALRHSNTGQGRVLTRGFRGMHYFYSLSLPSGLVVHSMQHHTAYYKEGDCVDVALEPNQTLTCFVNSDSAAEPETGHCFLALTGEKARQNI